MITINANIKVLTGDNEQLNVKGINAGRIPKTAQISSVIGSKAKGSNPLMLGVTPLGTHPSFHETIPYYIGNIFADEQGKFPRDIHIDLEYADVASANNISITFDSYNNQFPTEIWIEGKKYYNDSPTFTIATLDPSQTIKQIGFNVWNTPNYPPRIESISLGLEINIDRLNKLSYNGNVIDRASVDEPSWGIISNSGNISFNDTFDKVADYASKNLLKEGLSVEVYLTNTLNKKQQKIGEYFTGTWDYDNDNKEVSVSLVDDLEEWQNILFEGINFNPMTSKAISFYDVYDELWSATPKKYNMIEAKNLDPETQNILRNTYVLYPTLEPSNLWAAWVKLCNACQLKIYKKNGNTICKYNRGN